MKRTTLYLDEAVDLELKRLAAREARSQADLMRDALSMYVESKQTEQRVRPKSLGVAANAGEPIANRDEELLFADLDWPQKA